MNIKNKRKRSIMDFAEGSKNKRIRAETFNMAQTFGNMQIKQTPNTQEKQFNSKKEAPKRVKNAGSAKKKFYSKKEAPKRVKNADSTKKQFYSEKEVFKIVKDAVKIERQRSKDHYMGLLKEQIELFGNALNEQRNQEPCLNTHQNNECSYIN